MMYKKSLIAYAMNFASFIVDSVVGDKINKIILFGSVARGDTTEESDIDLFIDAPENIEKEIMGQLALYQASQAQKLWKHKGATNELSLKVGNLDKWQLKREVISSGILLYGKYSELPKHTTYYLLLTLDVKNKKIAKQVKLWRALYGYTQKVGKKIYRSPGLLAECGGKKIGKALLLVPMEQRKPVLDMLKKHHVRHTLHELWSDAF